MAILHVRNVPQALYERLRRKAAAERRSLSAEVVRLLEAATELRPEAEAIVLERIDCRRALLRERAGTFPSSVELIREDRQR